MTGAFVLALALAQGAQPAPINSLVSLWTVVTLPDGSKRHVSGVRLDKWATEAQIWHFVAKPTVCNTSSQAWYADSSYYARIAQLNPVV